MGYGKVHWADDNDGGRNYATWGTVHPAWRRRGLGRAILHANQRRLREIGAGAGRSGWRRSPVRDLVQREPGRGAWRSSSPRASRPRATSSRCCAQPWTTSRSSRCPTASRCVPCGLRTTAPSGTPTPRRSRTTGVGWTSRNRRSSASSAARTSSPSCGGSPGRATRWPARCNNFVMREFNAQTGARRGLLGGVSVRRPWRGRGLARALVSQSLVAFRDRGMTDAVLGVDADNPTGALGVYEANGFVVHQRERAFRKPFPASRPPRPRRHRSLGRGPGRGPRGSRPRPAR